MARAANLIKVKARWSGLVTSLVSQGRQLSIRSSKGIQKMLILSEFQLEAPLQKGRNSMMLWFSKSKFHLNKTLSKLLDQRNGQIASIQMLTKLMMNTHK